MIEYYIPEFAALIESLADGGRTREDIIEQLIDQKLLAPTVLVPDRPNYDAVLRP